MQSIGILYSCTTIIMASLSHLQLSLLLLYLFNVTLVYSSRSSEKDMDYNNWISWNIQNYRQKATLKAKSKVEAPGTSRKGLDVKQWKAEMNKVRISVSQNGTSDFKTIREALNSIPLYNTRRVILVISPGVYRYFI